MQRGTVRTALTGAGIALAARALLLVVQATALTVFHPRRNPALRTWDAPLDGSHALPLHLAHIGERAGAWRFLQVARHGWPTHGDRFSDVWPLAVWIVRALHELALPVWIAATVLTLTCQLAAGAAIALVAHRLAGSDRFGGSDRPATSGEPAHTRVTLLWTFAPLATAASFDSPLALAVTLLAAAWLASLRARPVLTGLLAGAAALAHPLAVCALPLVVCTRTRAREPKQVATNDDSASRAIRPQSVAARITGIALALAGVLAWPARWAFAGSPLQPVHDLARMHAHISYAGPLGSIWNALRQLVHGAHAALVAPLDLSASPPFATADPVAAWLLNLTGLIDVIGLLALALIAWRRLGIGPALWLAACALVGILVEPQHAAAALLPARSLLALPAFVLLERFTRRETAWLVVLTTSACLAGVFATTAALGSWPG